MSAKINQYLEHQTKEFHDVDGRRWCVRIEQGGGRPGAAADDPPIARLIFHDPDNAEGDELAAPGTAGNWDLASYDEPRLRALLSEAQTRAKYPRSE